MEFTRAHAHAEPASDAFQVDGLAVAEPRHNFYAVVHKGLRACLADVIHAAGRADPSDEREIAQVVARVRSLCMMYRLHAAKENDFVHPAMEARRPGSSRRTTDDHEEHERSLVRLEADAQAVETAAGRARVESVRTLYSDLGLFAADDLVHMHAEETDNNAVLWACYSDAELAEIERNLVASIPPAHKMAFVGWMTSSCNPAERATLLAGMRAGAPAQVFESILALVKARLSDAEWGKLSLALAG